MKIPSSVNEFMQQPMDRKDFLKHLAVGAVMVMGGGMIVQSLGGMDKLGVGNGKQQGVKQSSGNGYGASVYGGNKA